MASPITQLSFVARTYFTIRLWHELTKLYQFWHAVNFPADGVDPNPTWHLDPSATSSIPSPPLLHRSLRPSSPPLSSPPSFPFLRCPSNADPNSSWGSCPPVASFPPIPTWNYLSVPVSQTPSYPRNQPQLQEIDPLGHPAEQRPARISKSKRRKTQPKSVCHFTGETLSSDPWAWHKYGQKPIKRSPYSRCSSSKACMVRKQMERSGNDPGVFVVMYTREHSHPLLTHHNSLARSRRGGSRRRWLGRGEVEERKGRWRLKEKKWEEVEAGEIGEEDGVRELMTWQAG